MYTRWLPMLNQKKIILASGSAQRIKHLSELGLIFEAIPSDFPENLEKCNPKEYVEKTCKRKFEDFMLKNEDLNYEILISGDTIVENNGVILEKPESDSDIYEWFKKYSNSKVYCYSSMVIGVIKRNEDSNKNEVVKSIQFTTETILYFDELTNEAIEDYIKSGDGAGKAGALYIQGKMKTFIKKIEGCYYNVIGFPTFDFVKNLMILIKDVYGEDSWNI